jgi:hypothetical protein
VVAGDSKRARKDGKPEECSFLNPGDIALDKDNMEPDATVREIKFLDR